MKGRKNESRRKKEDNWVHSQHGSLRTRTQHSSNSVRTPVNSPLGDVCHRQEQEVAESSFHWHTRRTSRLLLLLHVLLYPSQRRTAFSAGALATPFLPLSALKCYVFLAFFPRKEVLETIEKGC